MTVRRITRAAVLTAVALGLFILELRLPSPVPIPGVKLGLANIVTVFSLFLLGPADTFWILLTRILLGSIFAGQIMALAYSLAGGTLCYLVMLALRRVVTPRQIWAASIAGALAHNIGQITVAILVTSTPALLSYLPVLTVSGILTGLFTGLAAQFAYGRLRGIFEDR